MIDTSPTIRHIIVGSAILCGSVFPQQAPVYEADCITVDDNPSGVMVIRYDDFDQTYSESIDRGEMARFPFLSLDEKFYPFSAMARIYYYKGIIGAPFLLRRNEIISLNYHSDQFRDFSRTELDDASETLRLISFGLFIPGYPEFSRDELSSLIAPLSPASRVAIETFSQTLRNQEQLDQIANQLEIFGERFPELKDDLAFLQALIEQSFDPDDFRSDEDIVFSPDISTIIQDNFDVWQDNFNHFRFTELVSQFMIAKKTVIFLDRNYYRQVMGETDVDGDGQDDSLTLPGYVSERHDTVFVPQFANVDCARNQDNEPVYITAQGVGIHEMFHLAMQAYSKHLVEGLGYLILNDYYQQFLTISLNWINSLPDNHPIKSDLFLNEDPLFEINETSDREEVLVLNYIIDNPIEIGRNIDDQLEIKGDLGEILPIGITPGSEAAAFVVQIVLSALEEGEISFSELPDDFVNLLEPVIEFTDR